MSVSSEEYLSCEEEEKDDDEIVVVPAPNPRLIAPPANSWRTYGGFEKPVSAPGERRGVNKVKSGSPGTSGVKRKESSVILLGSPTDTDILCGRLKYAFAHPGNIKFREILKDKYLPDYIIITDDTKRKKKSLYFKFVADSLKKEYGARFMKRVGVTQWALLNNRFKRKLGMR